LVLPLTVETIKMNLTTWIIKQVVATCLSLTVAGNSGVSAFLTLFVVGIIGRFQPDLLGLVDENALIQGVVNGAQRSMQEEDGDEQMDQADEVSGQEDTLTDDISKFATMGILSTIPALVVLAALTILEIVAMCVPIVDHITDTILTFAIPVVSSVGVISTWNVFPAPRSSYSSNSEVYAENDIDGAERRRLNQISDTFQTVWQVSVLVVGIVLALSMHLFKMLVRLIGQGWLTNCLAVLETIWTVCTLVLVIFIKTFAVFIAVMLVGAAIWGFTRRERRARAAAARKRQLEQEGKDTKKSWCWGRQKKNADSDQVDEEKATKPAPVSNTSRKSKSASNIEASSRAAPATPYQSVSDSSKTHPSPARKQQPTVEGRTSEFFPSATKPDNSSEQKPKKKRFWQNRRKDKASSSGDDEYQAMT
jgi:hypothetical protein